ncbi:MAG: cytochrome c biogenesis protein ResB [Armatimonadota bacterium]
MRKTAIEPKSNSGRQDGNSAREIGALEALWSFFGSMQTAIVLLLVIAAASIVGTIIEQNAPAGAYIRAYGEKGYRILRGLGLTDVYHSGWYTLLLGLFSLNLAVCSIKRFGIAWRRTFRPRVVVEPDEIARLQRSEKIPSTASPEYAASKAAAALRARHYHVISERSGDSIFIHASRGRLGVWGPYVTHLSILVIFAGAVAGSLLGSRGYVKIAEGKRADSYQLESGQASEIDAEKFARLGFTVELLSFRIQYDDQHRATGYKSHLRVYDRGKMTAQKVIDVNAPLTYKGTSFFQSSYGLEKLVLRVTAPSGESAEISYKISAAETPEGLRYGIAADDNPMKQVRLGSKKLTLFIHNLAPNYVGGEQINASDMPLNPACDLLVNDRFPEYRGIDAWTRIGWLPVTGSASYKGYRIELARAVDYTVLQVSRNPGLPVVYAGFGLILLGVFASFYSVHRTVRMLVSPGPKGSHIIVGATSRADWSIFDRDFEQLRSAAS